MQNLNLSASIGLHVIAVVAMLWLNKNQEMKMPAQGLSVVSVRLIQSEPEQVSPVRVREMQVKELAEQNPASKKSEFVKEKTKTVTDEKAEMKNSAQNSNQEKLLQKAAVSSQQKQDFSETKTNNAAATIIYQPAPKIPDDLRREAANNFALVRFHIDETGVATTELLKPAENPRLNHILLETLKLWRFKPASSHGTGISSTFDIRIHFTVE